MSISKEPFVHAFKTLQADTLWIEVPIRSAQEVIDIDDSSLTFDHLKSWRRVLKAMAMSLYRFFVRVDPQRNVCPRLGPSSLNIELIFRARFCDAAGSCLTSTLVFQGWTSVCCCGPRDCPFRRPSRKSRGTWQIFVRTSRAWHLLIAACFRCCTVAAGNGGP
jgi:hypothetical protein